ncbi:hypothetical protein LOD99_12911 [Oopsacas minuta]|uniref:Uncharacterized protein n=1 Tax=Oopsacas minuta TaxID=111878 RepID=A0AAV7JAC8_9METZ|nr:hypothetical protein LOD99_12911 [Oopsacas minuta]
MDDFYVNLENDFQSYFPNSNFSNGDQTNLTFHSITNQLTFSEHCVTQYETGTDSKCCLSSLKLRLARTGTTCSPYVELLSLLNNEEDLRIIGAKSLNALLRQVSLSQREVSEVKLHKRRLRKRLAKRGWDSKTRTLEFSDMEALRLLREEKESLERERKFLLKEIQEFEIKLN